MGGAQADDDAIGGGGNETMEMIARMGYPAIRFLAALSVAYLASRASS
jgi:hypothetical protein